MSIRVIHDLDDLAEDLDAIAATAESRMAKVVSRQVRVGERVAQRFARESSGPHGLNYWRRITSESDGLEGEWGPRAGNMIGGGWRNGENTDLPRSADIVGPRFAKRVADAADDLFWPGA